MKRKSKAASNGSVRFELTHPSAQSVSIAGSFNDWHPAASPMIPVSEGKWRKELILPPGRYEYRFVVDGQWTDDPSATGYVPNPHGSLNAVRMVSASPQTEAKNRI